jgi:rubrerythrin
MNSKKFDEIIDFAINREYDAMKFYQDMQGMVKFNSQKELLKDFEIMEKGHANILKNIRNTDFKEIEIPEIENLEISDYIVESKPTSDMSYQDIIILAMKREEASYRLYNDMADRVGNQNIKKLFLKLASEEAKHKLHFEKIYDKEILTEN